MNPKAPVVSIYLEAGPVRDREFHKALLTTLAKHHDGESMGPLEGALRREVRRVRSYLDAHPHDGRPLAVFSSVPAQIFEVHQLPGNVRSELWIDDHRHLEPMAKIMARHPKSLIVATDKQRARIFIEVLGELQELTELVGQPIKRHRQGGIHRAPYQRRVDVHSDRNLGAVADWLDRFLDGQVPPIYVVAPPEARSSLMAHLSPRIRRAVVGQLHLPLYVDSPQLQGQLREALGAAEAVS